MCKPDFRHCLVVPLLRKNGETREALTVAEWAPLVDITEDEKEYLVKAELPEVKKEEIKLSVGPRCHEHHR